MLLEFHELAEATHRILNPLSHDKLMLLGEICRLQEDMQILDLACGKGEMLCQWAWKYGLRGQGVDISTVFLDAARARAVELRVAERLVFTQEDAGKYVAQPGQFDVVSCIGATWIGNGLVGTINLLKPALKTDGLMLIGEPYWIGAPPPGAHEALGVQPDDFTSLIGTLDRIESTGMELIEMVLANQDDWDRYEAMQWQTLSDYLRAHPDNATAQAAWEWKAKDRRAYLEYGRRYLGWGVFVLRSALAR
ncbi:MAG: class I SAM-dependent methyltransferase [Anaerolineae bacterium]|nr:class I SAM-dependent methyltransferase [Anaerolineae bacterium]